jgi:hypothetical protein
VAAGFGLLARARGDRALHPRGVVWAAEVTFPRAIRRFALGTADPLRRHVTPLADIRVTRRLDPAPPEAASFDPILHASPTFRQEAGRLDALRARSYRASRSGRSG